MNGWGYEVIRFFGPSVGFSVWIIATDEAGYGPKLGPLVVAATLWRTSGEGSATELALTDHRQPGAASPFDSANAHAADPLSLPNWIGDSKKIFASGKSLRPILTATAAALWATEQVNGPAETAEGWNADAVLDWAFSLNRSGESDAGPSENEASGQPAFWATRCDPPEFDHDACHASQALANRLRTGTPRLMDVGVRLMTAKRFNTSCQRSGNKANVAAEQTLCLVQRMLARRERVVCGERDRSDLAKIAEPTCIVCDRLGGRRYYSSPILMHLDVATSVIQESAHNSVYRWHDTVGENVISFRVGGDSFVPVGLASMVAKTIRELSMRRFNRFFIDAAKAAGCVPPKPTAGYPQDAKRFYDSVRELCCRNGLTPEQVWRDR